MVLAGSLANPTPTPLTRALAAYHQLDLRKSPRERARTLPPKRAKQLNAGELERLIAGYHAGATVYELAEQFKIDRRTVAIRLKQEGVSMRGKPATREAVDEMVRLYQSGLSLLKVGAKLGVSDKTVENWLRKRGVRTRPRRGSPRPPQP